MKPQFDFRNGKRGPVLRTPFGKTRITIRIDQDILDWFKKSVHEAGGGNYQTLINDALRIYVDCRGHLLEETFRRILREELNRFSGMENSDRFASRNVSS